MGSENEGGSFSARKVKATELQQLAEWLAIFQKLPERERIAIQYYIKGRMDAETGSVEIPAMAAV